MKKLEIIQSQIAATLLEKTGAAVEVTIRDGWVSYYSEQVDKKEAVLEITNLTSGKLLKIDSYEADQDGSAAFCATYEN